MEDKHYISTFNFLKKKQKKKNSESKFILELKPKNLTAETPR